MEERQVQAGVEAPDLVPLRAAQELGLRQPASHPVVEHRLQPAREHLQPERQRRPARMQLRQDLELPAVVLGAVVALAEQHRLRLGHPAQPGQARSVPHAAIRCAAHSHSIVAGGLLETS